VGGKVWTRSLDIPNRMIWGKKGVLEIFQEHSGDDKKPANRVSKGVAEQVGHYREGGKKKKSGTHKCAKTRLVNVKLSAPGKDSRLANGKKMVYHPIKTPRGDAGGKLTPSSTRNKKRDQQKDHQK